MRSVAHPKTTVLPVTLLPGFSATFQLRTNVVYKVDDKGACVIKVASFFHLFFFFLVLLLLDFPISNTGRVARKICPGEPLQSGKRNP